MYGNWVRITDQQSNRLQILRAIRRAEPVARTELASLTGMTTQTVSDIVSDLAGRNLLLETKAPAVGRGRPRTMLHLNPDAARAVGAFLLPDHRLGVEIADLRGDTLVSATHQLPIVDSAEALAPRIAAAIDETLTEGPISRAMIHSVGLGVPGVVDSLRGVLHWTPRYQAGPVPLAALVSDRLGLPVYLNSAADVLTRAEHWHGPDRQVDDFVLIFAGFGLGLGQYIDGMLRTGDHGLSPAFAHVKVTVGEGPVCICGACGCLTSYASISGVVSRIAVGRGNMPPRLGEMTESLHAFAAEARAGAADAQDAFNFAGLALGLAAANYINLWDPARMVVLVQDTVLMDMVTEPFRAALDASTVPALRERTPVDIRASEEIAFAKGTAALVLEHLYRGGGSS